MSLAQVSLMTLLMLMILLMQVRAPPSNFCSVYCVPTDCNGLAITDCTSGTCPANMMPSSGYCVVNPASNFSLLVQSVDLNGSSSMAISPSAAGSCNALSFYGNNYLCSNNFTISMPSGIGVPHYYLEVDLWLIFLDIATFSTTNNINFDDGNYSTITNLNSMSTQTASKSYCNGKTQRYYRLSWSFWHLNQTSGPFVMTLSSDIVNGGCFWGIKQVLILGKKCHAYCLTCFEGLSTQCYSCQPVYFLSGNTCNITCLATYGPVTGSNICIQCDSKCIYCSENSTYCSSCTTSAPNEAFLYNNACLLVCPNMTFTNITTHQCNNCPTHCIVCNFTACIQCDTGYGLLNGSCYNPCPIFYYYSNGSCLLCDVKCLVCSGGSATQCTQCTTNGTNQAFLITPTTCIAICPNGTFPNTTTHVCDACSSPCDLCSSASACVTCISGYGLLNASCYSPCPIAYYLQSGLCNPCDVKCLVCSGSNSTQCSACTTNGTNQAFLYSSSQCLAACPNGSFPNTTTHVCDACSSPCDLCSSPSACVSCISGYGFLNASCYSPCPVAYYIQSGLCNPCDVKCLVCSGSNSTQCSACTTNGTYQAFLVTPTTCLAICPNGTFPNTTTHVCDACSSPCDLCSSPSACVTCISSYGLLNSSCYNPCPNGYYITSGLCASCDVKCVFCSGPNATQCSACTTNGTNQAFLYSSSQCLAACPNGTFPNTTTHVCDACSSPCDLCSSASACVTCISGYGLLNSSCYNPCPNGYFFLNGSCIICDLKCSICFGPSSAQCSVCSSGYVLSNTTCDTTCLPDFGVSNTSGVCMICNAKCLVCTLAADNCSSCIVSGANQAFLDSTNPAYQTCVSTCNSSAFPNAATHVCQSCDANCLTCASSSTNCTSCNVSLCWLNFVCYAVCPSGYFNDGNNCTACNALCNVCNISATNCSVCNSSAPAYLLVNSCLTVCPDPYYQNNGSYLCSPCHSFCQSCVDSTNTNCQSCATNYTLSGSTCASNCLSGFGPSPTPQVCMACTYPCLTCNMLPTNCSTCNNSNTTYYWYKSGVTTYECVTSCPTTLVYTDNVALACKPCQTGCYQCRNWTYCYSCKTVSGYAWINTTYLCYNPCPINYYKQNTTNCSRCNAECTRCVNFPDNCTSCQTSGALRSFLLGNRCYISCPSPYFGNTTSSKCQLCDARCDICYNATNNDCLLCSGSNVQSGTTCSAGCAPFYGVTSNPSQCVACNMTCLACGYLSTNCSSCEVSGNFTAYLFVYNSSYSQCLMVCPALYFQNFTHQSCDRCNINCTVCEFDKDNCSSCIVGFGLLNSTCYQFCPDGYFMDGVVCTLCSQLCLECFGNQDNCSVCQFSGNNMSYWLNNDCLISCPIGYYEFSNSSTGPTLCLSCNVSCYSCDILADNCTICAATYYLFGSNTCVSVCPLGFFGYVPNMTCLNSSSTSVTLSLAMYFVGSSTIYVDLKFDHPLDPVTFSRQSFQSFSYNQSFDASLLSYSYVWLDSMSYRIIVKPVSYIYLYNCGVEVRTMDQPNVTQYSTDSVAFYYTVYNQSAFLVWTVIGSSKLSDLERTIIKGLSNTSDAIQSVVTLPIVQEFNKAGVMSLIFPGAQITSSMIVTDSVFSEQMYQGSRFWGNGVYFTVPAWQRNKNKTKYLFKPSADEAAKNARLLGESRGLMDVSSINWRYQRTGFTAIFVFDCYSQLLLILLSWLLVCVGGRLSERCRWNLMPKIWPIFHALHQIMIFYFGMGLILQLIYFQATALRVMSLSVAVLANAYLLVYTLVVYYSFMRYPSLHMGTKEYRDLVLKYGSFIRNIRYEDFGDEMNKWNPRQLFRPYNYHLLSYYKKVLMIVSIPLFMGYPAAEMGVLLSLQLMQLIRFCLTWPYFSRARNIFKLCLQLLLLLFFITGLVQCFLIGQIQSNNAATLSSAMDSYKVTGWVGLIAIMLFNIGCFGLLVVSLIQHCCRSNREVIRETRRNYYYEKIVKYEQSFESNITTDVLDSWVIKGDLNEKWVDDEKGGLAPIRVTIEKYTVNVMGDGFLIQVDKIAEAEMGQPDLQGIHQKVKVLQQLKGTVGLSKRLCPIIYDIIWQMYSKYDPSFESDYITIKTVARIDAEKYKFGERIDFRSSELMQTIVVALPFENKKQVHKQGTCLKGFPLNLQLLKPLVQLKEELGQDL